LPSASLDERIGLSALGQIHMALQYVTIFAIRKS
jgi:hypothetical protein